MLQIFHSDDLMEAFDKLKIIDIKEFSSNPHDVKIFKIFYTKMGDKSKVKTTISIY